MTTMNTIDFGIQASEDLDATLNEFSRSNLNSLQSSNVPTRKTEAWKYSAARLKLANSFPTLLASNQTSKWNEAYSLDCDTIVISNNLIQEHSLKSDQVTLKSFSELDESESRKLTEGAIAQSEKLEFAQLSAAYMQNGLYIQVQANAKIEKPLRVVFDHSGNGISLPRVFLDVGENASITLIEELRLQSEQPSDSLVSSVCDINVGANASVRYLRMNQDDGHSKHVGATGVSLHRDSRFESYCLALGSELARHDLLVKMLGTGAECDLNGVCITTDKQHFDNHTCIEHIAPHCTSNENYRCIADGKSKIVFNGRIHIHRDAQKTLGSMSNKNLLLSSEAEIDSKPELEIYADDVKCAHGTTIGQLDETELYYLKTRGICHEDAKLMLTLGFILEIVRATPVDAIAEYWEKRLSEILSYEL